MYTRILFIGMLTGLFTLIGGCKSSSGSDRQQGGNQLHNYTPGAVKKSDKKIQVAILLDTSNSMDGLIEQAKARLWNVVNTLTTLRYEGEMPTIEIALYEYGNMGLSSESDYIRKVSSLTTDLDLISEQLFSLSTNGGDEYCGAVIEDATNTLDWGSGESDMRLIYIAGNEEFNQGSVAYQKAIGQAREKDIYINTIFCGSRDEGISTFWSEGAKRGKGNFFTINQDELITEIETPYDQQISNYNQKMNDTYVTYGKLGMEKKSNQLAQDKNAESISYAVATERTVSKSSAVYSNESWDMVDRLKEDENALKTMSKEELPAELRGKSKKEIERYVAKKSKERDNIRRKVGELAQKRQAYIEEKSGRDSKKDDLGKAIQKSVIELAKRKGYTVAT